MRQLLVYKDTVLTEEQIKAYHDFFIGRYNIDSDPVEWLNLSKLVLIPKIDKLIYHTFLKNYDESFALVSVSSCKI